MHAVHAEEVIRVDPEQFTESGNLRRLGKGVPFRPVLGCLPVRAPRLTERSCGHADALQSALDSEADFLGHGVPPLTISLCHGNSVGKGCLPVTANNLGYARNICYGPPVTNETIPPSGVDELISIGGSPAAIAVALSSEDRLCSRQLVEYWVKRGYVTGTWAPRVNEVYRIPLHRLNPTIYPAREKVA